VKISVKISREKDKKEIDLKDGSTVIDLLKKLNLKPDTLIVLNDDIPIPIDEVLKDKQNLSIILVSSGG
jgi:sulfur carrier protein ThiS